MHHLDAQVGTDHELRVQDWDLADGCFSFLSSNSPKETTDLLGIVSRQKSAVIYHATLLNQATGAMRAAVSVLD